MAPCIDRPVNEYALSSVQFAKYHINKAGGDFELAKTYLERVATSNSELVQQATDLLKKLKMKQQQQQLQQSQQEAAATQNSSAGDK